MKEKLYMNKKRTIFKLLATSIMASTTLVLGTFANDLEVAPDDLANRGIYELQKRGINNWVVADTETKNDFLNYDGKTALYLPVSEKEWFLPDEGVLASSLYSLAGYPEGLSENRPAPSDELILTKEGKEDLLLKGDYSWFNGKLNVKEGRILMDPKAVNFGGNIEIAKDATFTFSSGEVEEGESTYTHYGFVKGAEEANLEIGNGLLFLKGDNSEFKGKVKVAPGAQLFLQKGENEVPGKIFGGTYQIMDEEGNLGEMVLATNEELTPLTLLSGRIRIQADTTLEESNSPIAIEELQIEKEGKVLQDRSGTNFYDTTIKGELEVTGDKVNFHNLNIDGGKLIFTGKKSEPISLTGEVKLGSSLVGDGNVIEVQQADFIEIYAGRTFTLDQATFYAKGFLAGNDSGLEVLNSTLYLADENANLPEKRKITNSTVLGNGAKEAAGEYDEAGNLKRFVVEMKDLKVADGTLKATVEGLKEKTKAAGEAVFEYTTDYGKTWNVIGKSLITRENEDSLVGEATISWDPKDLKNYQVRVGYEPASHDNYEAGPFTISEIFNPSKPTAAAPTPAQTVAPSSAPTAPGGLKPPAPAPVSAPKNAKTGDLLNQKVLNLQLLVLVSVLVIAQVTRQRKVR